MPRENDYQPRLPIERRDPRHDVRPHDADVRLVWRDRDRDSPRTADLLGLRRASIHPMRNHQAA